jgi:uncharacterized iron-regulated protein
MKLPTSLLCAVLAWACCACSTPAVSPPPSPYLLLGEVHDNAPGHRLRATHLSAWVAAGWRPAIVMEQFDRERADALSQAMQACADADCVIQKAGSTGWDWPLYRPLIDLALRHHLPLLAGNVSRKDAARVMREGLGAVLTPQERADFGLPDTLRPELQAAQQAAIEQGHCGQAPADMLPGFVNAQVARDIWMAKVMADHAQQGVVMIAGNGHVRRDWGVPYWLRARGITAMQSVGYITSPSEADQFDVSHLVGTPPEGDPCADMPAGK